MRDYYQQLYTNKIKIVGRNINYLRYAEDTTLMSESEEELKTSWWTWKRRVKKLVYFEFTIQKTKIVVSSSITSWKRDGETVRNFIFLGSKITADGDCSHEINRHLLLGRKAITKLDSVLKSRDITLLIKIRIVKAMIFLSSHERMWELDHKEGWVLKNGCFQMVLEKTLESSLDNKEIKPFNLKGNQAWIFIGRTDAEATMLFPLKEKSWLFGKDPDVEKHRK